MKKDKHKVIAARALGKLKSVNGVQHFEAIAPGKIYLLEEEFTRKASDSNGKYCAICCAPKGTGGELSIITMRRKAGYIKWHWCGSARCLLQSASLFFAGKDFHHHG